MVYLGWAQSSQPNPQARQNIVLPRRTKPSVDFVILVRPSVLPYALTFSFEVPPSRWPTRLWEGYTLAGLVVKQYLCCTWSRHQLHFLLSPHCLKSTYDQSKSFYTYKFDQVLSYHQMRRWKIFANPFKNILALLPASQ